MMNLVALLGVILGFGAAAVEFGGLLKSILPELPAPRALPTPAPRAAPALPVPREPRRITLKTRPNAARCPVCANEVKGQVLMCPRCQSVSHEDCWKYQGGCAIFACEPK